LFLHKIDKKKISLLCEPFYGHADQAVQCRVHPPVLRQIQGYPRCHWTPPLGEYSPRIAPADADAMVIYFGVEN
jgi:hypothetical protein